MTPLKLLDMLADSICHNEALQRFAKLRRLSDPASPSIIITS